MNFFPRNRVGIYFLGSILLILLLMVDGDFNPVWAGSHWLSNSYVDGQVDTGDIDVEVVEAINMQGGNDERVFDFVVSIYRETVTAAIKTKYEKVIKRMADGIYESSNAKHKLGKVYVYKKRLNRRQCDVSWESAGGPCATPSGWLVPGANIQMFDNLVDGIS